MNCCETVPGVVVGWPKRRRFDVSYRRPSAEAGEPILVRHRARLDSAARCCIPERQVISKRSDGYSLVHRGVNAAAGYGGHFRSKDSDTMVRKASRPRAKASCRREKTPAPCGAPGRLNARARAQKRGRQRIVVTYAQSLVTASIISWSWPSWMLEMTSLSPMSAR